jgi:hypothetical protein
MKEITVIRTYKVDIFHAPEDAEEGEQAGWRAIVRMDGTDPVFGPYDTKKQVETAVRRWAVGL